MTRRRLESGLRDYEDDSISDGLINRTYYRVPYSESISRLSIGRKSDLIACDSDESIFVTIHIGFCLFWGLEGG